MSKVREMGGRTTLRTILTSGVAAGAIAMSAPVMAQDEDEEPAAQQQTSIVVTGSRIQRRDFVATSPIVTVDSELTEMSSSINLEANLNKLPQFAPAITQFIAPNGRGDIQANANNTLGATTVSLRQLGSNRNLVLINGRRPTPINGSGVVDINSIPSAAIERVEVISGGASSTYGADAVGGVVNFILKRNFTGLNIDTQYGISQEGDGDEFRIATLFGASLDDGRGNVMMGMEYYDRKSVRIFDRDAYVDLYTDPQHPGNTIFSFEQDYITFPNAASRPDQADMNALFYGKGASTAVNVPTNQNLYLNTDGSLFLNGSTGTGAGYTPYGGVGYTGTVDGINRKLAGNGLLRDNYVDQFLSTPTERYSFFASANYDLNDWISAFGQATFAKTRVFTRNLVPPAISSWGVLIPHGDEIYEGNSLIGVASSLNADGTTHADYLPGGRFGLNCGPMGGCTNSEVFPTPPELTQLLDGRALPNADFQINKYLTQVGRRFTDNQNMSFQVMAGFNGEVPSTDITWEIFGSHGEAVAKTDQYNFASVQRWRLLLASPNYGLGFNYKANSEAPGGGFQGATGTCTSGVNPFTTPVWTDDCADAVRLDLQNENRVKQDMVEFNTQGGLFDLPYGQLRFALGAAYRKNSIQFKTDSASTEGTAWYESVNGIYPQGNTNGSTDVSEIYGELLIPLLSDMPFVEELNLELGYRLSDYSTVGTVSTFKINGDWAPTYWLRFRGGYQQASRAPNLGELFTSATSTLDVAFDGDPCSRANPAAPTGIGNYSANPDANPDAAQVEGLCRQIMGAEGAEQYYRDGRTYNSAAFTFSFPQLVGNPFLSEETAKTYTIGGVLTSPSSSPWLERLSLAVDYYNVNLTDGIAASGVAATYRRCFASVYNPNYELNEFCSLIQRVPATGEVGTIGVTYANGGQVQTDGIDWQLNWAVDLEDAGVGLPGVFSTSVQGTYLLHFKTTTDKGILPLTDFAGTLGGGEVGTNAGSYRWKLFTTFTYALDPVTVSLQWQHKPSVESAAFATGDTTITGAPAYDLFNLNGTAQLTDDVRIRFGIDNLFNKRPPLSGVNTAATDEQLAGGTYESAQYDVLGRRFYIGASFEF